MDTLTTPKHTPGPWTLHPGAGKKSERYIWREAPYPGGQCVAAVYPGITGEDERALDYPWSSRQEAADANAALIAAAPDLLAACHAALAYLDDEDSAGLVAEIAAAVAKAEGRTL